MNNFIKKGVMLADKKGTYIVADMDDRYIKLLGVYKDSKGNIGYGCKARFIGVDDLDNFVTV